MNYMLINGHHVQGQGNIFNVINPADESIITQLNGATTTQVDDAIQAAATAFQQWKKYTDTEVNMLFSQIVADLMLQKDEIAQLISLEQGKPLALAHTEVMGGIAWIESIQALQIPVQVMIEGEKTIEIHHRPLGVVASITPWNWPFMIAVWQIFPALKAKNCVVNKPSEYTPLSTLKLVEIINRHLPRGVCNLVLGHGDIGQYLSEHPQISKITFTGSTRTGQSILSHAVGSLKSVVLELGGNDAGIVLDDIENLDDVAQKIFGSAFLNCGQTCAALKRLYVHCNIYDALAEKLAQIADAQVVGNGLNAATQIGPLQNKQQYLKVKELIADAVAHGAQVRTTSSIQPEQGYYIRPTIMTNLQEGVRLVDEEQFGPVLPLIKFKDINEVIVRANNTEFGLGGSVWSSDLEQARQLASQIEAGTVWINSHSDLSPSAVFGGWKMSGQGYSFALEGLLLFTQQQAIHIHQAAE
ncbi:MULTISPECIES: aldehyde dehydrogenase family protein [unclassified Acinetobacter]|uniref:aldehyde dehydrogenase family protein n=1 Tax=unclassified Acinetobacter TaxID=196816 RepID=UPI0029342689|nr:MULTISPECIES: aldehyde dehydrogenase family protein [unclassified Acinetobacter]WOE32037.1 aldehyde dehydrogenase family protein [Acinetobacter sp. SAAs470]WOE37506.1 aldehyde dehydrogenase family protein [Acinetobacter sp. SAAs474]